MWQFSSLNLVIAVRTDFNNSFYFMVCIYCHYNMNRLILNFAGFDLILLFKGRGTLAFCKKV